MARVEISTGARSDLSRLIDTRQLPPTAEERVPRILSALEVFPDSGRQIGGRWTGYRFLIGPWSWFLTVYRHDSVRGIVTVVSVEDSRSRIVST